MKRIITLLLLTLLTPASAQPLSETDKIFATAKLWGFLKYYHSEVAKGKFEWDEQLFVLIKKTKAAQDKEQLSTIYEHWLNGLGKVKPCKKCDVISKKDYFDKNFDLSWTQDPKLFSPTLSARLKFIEENRFQGKSHYFKMHPSVGNVEFLNEKTYEKPVWQDRDLRLLSLIRYWNHFEYFSPYKYMTDQNWDDVLREMIPVFENAVNEDQLYLAMLELTAKTDDSHGGIYSEPTNKYFGLFCIPADYKLIDGKAVVNGFHDLDKAKRDDWQIGDAVEKANGRNLSDILAERQKYLPSSNDAVRKRRRYALLNGSEDSLKVIFSRDGKSYEKTVRRYLSNEFQDPFKNHPKWKIISGNIGYIDMGQLEISDIDLIWKELQDTKSLIIDVRNYPKSTMYMLAKKLFPKSDFVKLTQPDPDYPGKFFWTRTLSIGNTKNYTYPGKIVILVNETTQSHAEFTVMGLQRAPNCITIGTQTAGADGNVSASVFPSGTNSYITGLGVFYPDGTETQRKGVRIDIEVQPTISGIANKKDEILEKAIQIASE